MVDEKNNGKKDIPEEKDSSGRGKVIALIAVVALIIIGAAVFFVFMQPEERFPLSATITKVDGSVMVQDSDTAGTIPATEDMELSEGDRIITGTDGQVEITFVDGSKTRVAPDTRMDIQNLYYTADGAETTVLNVDGGKIWNAVSSLVEKNSRFEVNTPSSVAGVRGTGFSAEVGEDDDEDGNGDGNGTKSTYRVYEGSVGVSGKDGSENGDDDDDKVIGSGQQGSSSENDPTPTDPEKIDVLGVDDFDRDNLVEDLPEVYLDVEIETKDILVRNADETLSETEREIEILTQELSVLEEMLRVETDPARRAELEYLISNINEEINANREIADLVKQDRDELEEEKRELETLRESIKKESEELEPEQFIERAREAARSNRDREIERRPAREQRNNAVSRLQESRESSRREVESTATKLGISDTLRTIRETPPETTPPPATTPGTTEPQPPPAEPVTYSISLSRNIAAGGTVTGGGTYSSGRRLTITAVPADGFRFVNWTSGGQSVSSDATYTFNVNSNRSLVANFARIRYNVSLSVTPPGSGTTSGSGTYDSGSTVTVTANAASGYRFVSWTSGGRVVNSSRIYTFNINSNTNLTANFEQVEATVPDPTPDPDDPTDPDDPVDPDPDDPTDPDPDDPTDPDDPYDPDDPVDPDPDDPTDPDDPVDPDPDDPTDPDPDDPTDPDDPVEPEQVIINAAVQPIESGTVSGDGSFEPGDYVTLEAIANEGYRFVNWTSDGDILSEESFYFFTANNDMEIVANFEPVEYTVSLSLTPAESGEVSGGGTYFHGEEVTVTAVAAEGYVFLYWLESDEVVSQEAEYTFEASQRSLTAVFEEDIPPVEITDITAKHSKVSESIHAAYVLFRLSKEPGYVEVSVNGEKPFTFVGIDSDGRYLFEGITESEPVSIEIEIDGDIYTPDVSWENADATTASQPMEEDTDEEVMVQEEPFVESEDDSTDEIIEDQEISEL